jgi:hypothetical protein
MSTQIDPVTVSNLEEKSAADGGDLVATRPEDHSFKPAGSAISTPELVNTGSAASELDDGDNETETSSTLEFSASRVPAAFDAQAVVEEGSENESMDGSVNRDADNASGLEVMSMVSDSGEPGETDT